MTFAIDGHTIGHSAHSPNVPMDWDIQNESSLDGESAKPGTWDQIDVTYVKVWSWS